MVRAKAPMKNRMFRCDDATYDDAVAEADLNGENISDVLRQALREYTRKSRRARQAR